MRTLANVSLGALAVAICLGTPAGALAQNKSVPSDAASATDDEIIVTANKREERLIDVPLSVAAVSGQELADKRLVDLQDLSSRIPGLSLQRGASSGVGQRLILRGLNTGGVNGTVASSVDDVPLTISAANGNGGDFAADFDAYDLQRIEVLKGPQGTLYGAASLGGLIKYVTNKPETGRFSAGFDAGVYDIYHGGRGGFAKGYINAPISENAAFRGSAYYELQPGWISNTLSAQPRVNEVRRYGGRASLLLRPVEALTLLGTVMYQRRDADGYDIVEVNGYTNASDPFGLLNGYNKNTYLAEPNRVRSELYSLNATYDFGAVSLQSITSYGVVQTNYRFDNPIYFALGAFPPPTGFSRANTTLASDSVSSLKKFSQELRLSSNGESAKAGHGLEWQAGAFYTNETIVFENFYTTYDATTRAPVTTPAAIALTPPGTPAVFQGRFDNKYKEIAGYLDFTYYFSPKFDVELGGRLFRNDQNFSTTQGGAIFSPPAFTTTGPFSSSETRATFAIAPRVHFTPDVMAYARVASGYRPGGPNPAVPAANPAFPTDTPGQPNTTFGADTTINYEAGIKATLLNRTLTVDIAAFYVTWSDIQVNSVYQRGQTAYNTVFNAGNATSKGFEWNIGLAPTRGVRVAWLGAYTKATLNQPIPLIFALADQQLPYVPEWTTTVTGDFDVPLSDKTSLTFGGSLALIGDRFTNWSRRPAETHLKLPAYATAAAQVGLRTGPFTFTLYGKNLTGVRGLTTYAPGRALFPGAAFPGTAGFIRPREVGLRVSGRF